MRAQDFTNWELIVIDSGSTDDTCARAARVGARVTSVKGEGTVVKHLTLKQRILLQREEDGVTVECSLEDLVERRTADADGVDRVGARQLHVV